MAIVVEDGTQVAGANSYVSEATLTAYAAARGITITGNEDELLIQAMDYIEGLRYKGYIVNNSQPLEWPRTGVRVVGAWLEYYDIDEIPQKLKDGLCETALAIDDSNGPLANVEREVSSETVGAISVSYASTAASRVIVKKISNKLKDLLAPGAAVNSFDVSKA